MKPTLMAILLASLVIPLVYQPACGQTNDVVQVNMRDGEITGLKIELSSWHWWPKGTTDVLTGKLEEIRGVVQEAVFQGIRVSMLYGEFNNKDEAHRAAVFHSTTMAGHFYQGLWAGVQNKSIGDESWHHMGPTENVILFRSGRTCVLVGCHGEEKSEKWNQVAELLAKHIEQKILKGGRVIVPEQLPKPLIRPIPNIPLPPPPPVRP